MKKNVTLKQIAKELDVSVSTVSKALRDNEEIGLETRQKIQAFAKLYNYKPNSIALNLRNQSSKTIAIIVPQIVNHFFTNVVQGIERIATQRNYNVIITVSNDTFDKEVVNLQTLVNGSIDGFIISVAKETMRKKDYHHLNETLSQGVPIVLFDRQVEEMNCDKVIIDDVEGAQKATEKLIRSGVDNIVFISTEDFVSVGKLRLKGYRNALIQNNLEVNEQLIIKIQDELNSEEIVKYIEIRLSEILDKFPDVNGLIGVNEFYTITAANYFKKINKKIPEEISIIAFSDGDLPKYSYPSLTAVSQHGNNIGEAASKLLIDKLEGLVPEEEFQTIVIPTELIIRESTF